MHEGELAFHMADARIRIACRFWLGVVVKVIINIFGIRSFTVVASICTVTASSLMRWPPNVAQLINGSVAVNALICFMICSDGPSPAVTPWSLSVPL